MITLMVSTNDRCMKCQRFAYGNLVRLTVCQQNNEKFKFNTQSTGQIFVFTIEFLEATLFSKYIDI